MIKLVFLDHDNRRCLGLGISRENVNRLTAGMPINVKLSKLQEGGISIDGDILIFFGETERELHQQLAQFIGPETKVDIDPRLKSKLT